VPIKIGELYVGGLEMPFSRMKVTKDIAKLNGAIIECKYDKGQWSFLRVRTDKSFPNAFTTAKGNLRFHLH
jgi:mRNA-capping enzyme